MSRLHAAFEPVRQCRMTAALPVSEPGVRERGAPPKLAPMTTLEQARGAAGVRQAVLSDGVTAYDVHGDSGPWVVFVHGLLTPMAGFEGLGRRLSRAGFRVLRYDMFGRGLSDRPAIRYDPALYVRQLRELTESLAISSMHLGAWSMGGVVAGRFALELGERVERMVMIAPALFQRQPPLLRVMRRLPGMRAIVKRQTRRMVERLPYQHFRSPPPGYGEVVTAQLAFPGVGESLASTLRHFAFGYGDELRPLAEHPRRMLVVWGDADRTTPFENARRVCALFPRATLLTVHGARHAPHLENPEQVEPAIERFLRG
jgi:pimeloyl-ACP methyl ester carboxylesterase